METRIAKTERGKSRRDAGFESVFDVSVFRGCIHFIFLCGRFVDDEFGQSDFGRDEFILSDAGD